MGDSVVIENLYYYRADLIRCIDGDSIVVSVDRGFDDRSTKTLRLARIDCPEMRGKDKADGSRSKAATQKLVEDSSDCIIKSVELDSFGRAIAEVYLEIKGVWRNLSDELVLQGKAKYRNY